MSLRLPKRNALPFIVAGTLAAVALVAVLAPRVLAVIQKSQGAASNNVGHMVRQPFANGNGLVAWYPMDGNAQDASGNGNDGKPFNAPSFGVGKFGKAFSLNGTNQYASAPQVTLSSSFTVSAWVNVAVTGDRYSIVSEAQPGGNCTSDIFNLSVHYDYGEIEMCNPDGSNTTQFARGGTPFIAGTWHLIVGTFNGSTGLLNEYTDGALIASTSTGYSHLVTGRSQPLTIGGNQFYFPGSIDDVRIYNRALSASEVTQLYQGSQPVTCDQYCVGWWKLDESSGTTAKDTTSNGNAGTLTNFTFDGTTNGWTSGVFGNALQFSQSKSNYVSVPDNSSLDLTNSFTLAAWVNIPTPPSISQKYDVIVKGQADVNPVYNYRLIIAPQSTAVTVLCSGVVSAAGTEYYSCPTVNQSQFFGSWHYLAETEDGSTLCLYLDGILVSSTSAPAPLKVYTNPLTIGGSLGYDASTASMNGSIDDVRVYTRALADYEIYDQYSAGR